MKKIVSKSLKTSYQRSSHTNADATSLVLRVANKCREQKLQTKVLNRQGISKLKLIADLRLTGRQQFKSSSLSAFNKRIADFKAGELLGEGETDDIVPPRFQMESEFEM